MDENLGPLAPVRGEAPLAVRTPAIELVRRACHAPKGRFAAVREGNLGRMRFEVGQDHLDLTHPEEVPSQLRHPDDAEAFADWVRAGVQDQLDNLDGTTLDIAALAVVMFYQRTSGSDISLRFPLLIDDCLDWRGVDPRKRSRELRQGIDRRIRLLFNTRLCTAMSLHLLNPVTGRRRLEEVLTDGPFLVEAGTFSRTGAGLPGDARVHCPDGYILSLGEWARAPVRVQAMLGPYFRRLAEYDLRREQWERQIGWYVVTQLQNQASKMTIEVTGKTEKIIPQQPFTLLAILNGSCMPWQHMAKNDPGAVIAQTLAALENVKRDGLIGEYTCIDGNPDGSDLPQRGRLEAILKRRYLITPGRLMLSHVKAKIKAKIEAKKNAKKSAAKANRTDLD